MTGGARPGPATGLLLLGILATLPAGCGIVGSPVAPESIGVAAQQARERERDEKAARERREAPAEPVPAPEEEEGEEQVLPPLRPIGTR